MWVDMSVSTEYVQNLDNIICIPVKLLTLYIVYIHLLLAYCIERFLHY